MSILAALLGWLRALPGIGGWLKGAAIAAGTAVLVKREQAHAQEMADAAGKLTRAQADLDAARANRDRNLAWMRANRPRSVQPISLDRGAGGGRGDPEP